MKHTERSGWTEIFFFRPLRSIIACGVVILVVLLCINVPKWFAAFKDEVEYSKDLKDHTPAYADIVSIAPIEKTFVLSGETPDLYCKCTLVNEDIIWVRFTVPKYVHLITPDATSLSMEEVTFNAPLRLHGAVDTVGKVIDAFRDNNNFVLIVDSVEVAPD